MKTSAIVCAVLAGTFGFSTIASAQGWRDHDRGDRGDRGDRVEHRQDRRDARRDWREDRREDRRDERWRERARHPHYVYGTPTYRVAPAYPARFHRGGYLPWEYRSHVYYVNDWHAYPRLYAPPYGHQWVNVDGEFLLVAIATGVIVNALLN